MNLRFNKHTATYRIFRRFSPELFRELFITAWSCRREILPLAHDIRREMGYVKRAFDLIF